MKAIAPIFLSAFLSVSANAFAAENYDDIPENFIKLIAAKKFQEAVDHLYPGKTYWSTPQGLAEKSNISAKLEKYGDYRFHKLLSEKSIDGRYATLSYFIGFQEKPAFLSIAMYKPENSWKAKEFNISESPYETKNFNPD